MSRSGISTGRTPNTRTPNTRTGNARASTSSTRSLRGTALDATTAKSGTWLRTGKASNAEPTGKPPRISKRNPNP